MTGAAGAGAARVEVHLAVPTSALAAAGEAVLSAEEARRAAAFQHAGARAQFLVGRWLARSVLGEVLGCPPREVPLALGERGALAVEGAGAAGWRVNLSHTEGLVAVAVARGVDVGVDVEDAARRGRTVELAERFFAAEETRALAALPEARQRARFFALWTLKEAYIKAMGQGLAIPLGRFAFDLDRGPGAAIGFAVDPAIDPDGGRWRFVRFSPDGQHALAVCAASGERPLLVRLRWRGLAGG